MRAKSRRRRALHCHVTCVLSRLQVPKQNKEIIGGKHKNRESSGMGHSMGRAHMQKQDLNTMNLMKFKVTPPLPPFSAAGFLFRASCSFAASCPFLPLHVGVKCIITLTHVGRRAPSARRRPGARAGDAAAAGGKEGSSGTARRRQPLQEHARYSDSVK